MKKRPDLYMSTTEDFKKFYVTKVKEDLQKHLNNYGNIENMDYLLEYLFDKGHHKGEVDQRKFQIELEEKYKWR